MTDTPRVDKHVLCVGSFGIEIVSPCFARELERELALVTKERDACRDWLRAYLGEIEQIAKTHDIVRLKSECGL